MGSSSSCKQMQQCQEKEIHAGSILNSITINAIVESSECIPQEARTIQLYKSQKSILNSKETEFDKRISQLGRADHIQYQMPSIKVLDSMGNNLLNQSGYAPPEIRTQHCCLCHQVNDSLQGYTLECLDFYHQSCLISYIRNQITNGNCTLLCMCQQKIHTQHLRSLIPDDNLISKFFSNQLGTLQQKNQDLLHFSKSESNQRECCFHCKKLIISQKIQLKCKHSIHKYCLKEYCTKQIELDKTYLICYCGAQVSTQLLRQFKNDSFKLILSKLFKNQLVELYNTNKFLQNKFHFKQFIKAVNYSEEQKQSSYSMHIQ
ncbi:unnamed protein product (macronuclear) [Paramecium tetraurelia]|uniref:RING-type domain-containing protein n=1 Tax=Paramecium tetraurelia TaxID=5888 RepID=A0BC46_PARTE|nr:uncharacterized protein GSPATT00000549001 [Paramecium tetraurelia]CAK56113.1 unnamed protein product [Paramecium tetraurelia]|eukprot:XP_001423511.1 hypothetical protein (macronuclear) [Paramecium tetraurelia strain d4-2]